MPLASSKLLGATAAICVLCSPTERKPFLLPCCAPPDKTDTPRGEKGWQQLAERSRAAQPGEVVPRGGVGGGNEPDSTRLCPALPTAGPRGQGHKPQHEKVNVKHITGRVPARCWSPPGHMLLSNLLFACKQQCLSCPKPCPLCDHAGKPEPLVFHIPQAFFDALQQRISSGSTKKRLPNSTTGKKLAYTLKALCIPLKAGKSPHEADTPPSCF